MSEQHCAKCGTAMVGDQAPRARIERINPLEGWQDSKVRVVLLDVAFHCRDCSDACLTPSR